MSTPVEDMSETQVILDLALTLFHAPDVCHSMTDEEGLDCACAAIELLLQYRRKLATGEQPVLTQETQHILARLEDGAFMPTTH